MSESEASQLHHRHGLEAQTREEAALRKVRELERDVLVGEGRLRPHSNLNLPTQCTHIITHSLRSHIITHSLPSFSTHTLPSHILTYPLNVLIIHSTHLLYA